MISEKISINILIKENRYIDKQYVFFILICRSLARQPKNLSKPHFHRNLQQINTTATLRHCDTATLRQHYQIQKPNSPEVKLCELYHIKVKQIFPANAPPWTHKVISPANVPPYDFTP